MKVILSDVDTAVLAAWRAQFARHPEVEVAERPILDSAADALVLPENSFGFMDSGLGLKFADRFGLEIQEKVRAAVRDRYSGEMLVGQAEVFPTGGTPPYIVFAPVTRTGGAVDGTVNVYLAARAALIAALATGGKIASIAFPAMGAGAGKLHPLIAARQLRYAFEEATGLRKRGDQNLSRLARREKKMKDFPAAKEEEE
jgi:O-acetyl-ADP-ribose deacetylase (regulator of RNase III)